MNKFIGPLVLFLVGLGLLLIQLDLFPAGKVMWTGGLLIGSVCVFLNQGFNKSSFIPGTILLTLSILSLVRYNTGLSFEMEIPIILMVVGVIMALNKTSLIPDPKPAAEDKTEV
jgi:uncharacterized membrane protein YhhN